MGLTEVLGAGLALALGYNPIASAVSSAVAAAYLSRGARPSRVALAAGVLAAAWLAADGLRVLASARDAYDGVRPLLATAEPAWAAWTVIAVWAAGGLAAGYALPAWAGTYAGRRTVFGIEWLVAASVAVTVALALSALAGALAR